MAVLSALHLLRCAESPERTRWRPATARGSTAVALPVSHDRLPSGRPRHYVACSEPSVAGPALAMSRGIVIASGDPRPPHLQFGHRLVIPGRFPAAFNSADLDERRRCTLFGMERQQVRRRPARRGGFRDAPHGD